MKALIAVLSTRSHPYGEMIGSAKATWDSVDVPGVETIFYVGEPQSDLNDGVLGTPVRDRYGTIGHKNIAAWKWMLDNRDFDFMARVNASCYVHKARLLARCEEYPKTGFLSGGIVEDPNRPHWLWGGYQFVMSRDVVQTLVDNADKWDHNLMEDMALSYLATTCGIPFSNSRDSCSIDRVGNDEWMAVSTGGMAFKFKDWKDLAKLSDRIFFRVKQDQRRHEDAMVMQKLFENLTP